MTIKHNKKCKSMRINGTDNDTVDDKVLVDRDILDIDDDPSIISVIALLLPSLDIHFTLLPLRSPVLV